jgi:hypothetical protein
MLSQAERRALARLAGAGGRRISIKKEADEELEYKKGAHSNPLFPSEAEREPERTLRQ